MKKVPTGCTGVAAWKFEFSQEEKDFIYDQYYNHHKGIQTIAKNFPECSSSTIYSLFHQMGWKCRDNREQALKNTCNEHYFDVIDNEHKAYWVGFFYADGYICAGSKKNKQNRGIGFSVNIKDKELLEKFKKDIEFTGDIKYYTSTTTYGTTSYGRITISSPQLADALIDRGCLIQKTTVLQFPTSEQIPECFLWNFIRGYIDGDGSYTDNRISICGTKELLDGLQNFIGSPNKLSQKRKIAERGVNNCVCYIYKKTLLQNCLEKMYCNATIYLNRKKEKAKHIYIERKMKYDEQLCAFTCPF